MSKQIDALKLALEALENNSQTHHYCEDTWYSCPKHEDGCANELEGDECNCGADEINAQFDKAITAIKEALAQPEQDQDEVDIRSRLYQRIHELETQLAQPTSGDYALGYSIGFGEGHSAGKALAQPEQEPLTENGMYRLGYHNGYGFGEAYGKANAPQRTWVGLTDEEIDQGLLRSNYALQTAGAWRDGVEWATKQLKDKNK